LKEKFLLDCGIIFIGEVISSNINEIEVNIDEIVSKDMPTKILFEDFLGIKKRNVHISREHIIMRMEIGD